MTPRLLLVIYRPFLQSTLLEWESWLVCCRFLTSANTKIQKKKPDYQEQKNSTSKTSLQSSGDQFFGPEHSSTPSKYCEQVDHSSMVYATFLFWLRVDWSIVCTRISIFEHLCTQKAANTYHTISYVKVLNLTSLNSNLCSTFSSRFSGFFCTSPCCLPWVGCNFSCRLQCSGVQR